MVTAHTTAPPVSRRPSLLEIDFFPDFSKKVRRIAYHPLGVLGGAGLVALLCGFFLHEQGFVLSGGVLTVMTLGVVWPWLSLRGLSGRVAFAQPRTVEGEAVEVRLTLRNRLPWSAYGIALRDGFAIAGDRPAAGIAATPRNRSALCRWSFVPTRRGIYPLRTPRLTTGFPFGLWENSKPTTVEQELIVWPRTLPVGPVPISSGDRLVEGSVARGKVGSNGDVIGVRPYRRGDSPRRIHWAQSARHDRLIVCELQANSRPVIQFVLDIANVAHVGDGENGSREWAIRVAASFAKGWLEDGAEIGFVCAAIEIPPAAGEAQLQRIMDAIARIPETGNVPLREVLARPACRGFRDGMQIVITTDRAAGEASGDRIDRRLVILRSSGFGGSNGEATFPPPWLLIDRPESVPVQLRGGWREAIHGS